MTGKVGEPKFEQSRSLNQNILETSGSWDHLQQVSLCPDATRNEALLSRHQENKECTADVSFFPAK